MRFDTNIDWVQLARYFSGEATPEERAVMESRIDSDSQYREAFEHAKKVWHASKNPTVGVDTKHAWDLINAEIEHQEHLKKTLKFIKRDRGAAPRHTSRKIKRRSSTWAIPSLLLVLVLASVYFFSDGQSVEPPSPELATFKTTAGQRATVTLPDGSEALLNAESQIQVLTSPSDPTRVIKLEGEAYFSVISDPTRPFYVKAGEAEVKVVGTSFSVSAYPEKNAVHVLVTEGKVRLSKNGVRADSMLLIKNDMGVLASHGVPVRTQDVPVEKLLAWREGILFFEHTPFTEVARTLERWFDLEISLSDPEIANRHLSSSFEDPTPNSVISVIAKTLNLDYSIQENTVTFFIPEGP